MRQADTLRPLTDDELIQLLAPVPLAQQQRDALVRISLRPGLPADYAGPVELADLRLSLSPWHWLKHMFAENAHSVELNQRINDAREAGESLETVAKKASWLAFNELFDETGEPWNSEPGDNYYFGHYGILGQHDDVHFLHPSFELQIVLFFPEASFSEGIVVAQAEWGNHRIASECWREEDGGKATGKAGVYFYRNEGKHDWMLIPEEMWLTDSITGQSCALGIEGDWVDDDEESEDTNDLTGATPGQADHQSGIDNGFSVELAGLRYKAGQLYRADTNALLTLSLPRPKSATA